MCPSLVFVSTVVGTSGHDIVVVYCDNIAEHVGQNVGVLTFKNRASYI